MAPSRTKQLTPSALKLLRAKLGLTQRQLGAKLSVQRNTVNRWEMGLHPISQITGLALREIQRQLKPQSRR